MTRPRSDWAVSMDALAERCFQLDANRPKKQLLLARPRGRVSDAVELFLTATTLISLALIVVAIAIGGGFWAAFGLRRTVAARHGSACGQGQPSERRRRDVPIRRAAGRD